MANKIQLVAEATIVGDGSSLSVRLSLGQAPFPLNPPGRLVGMGSSISPSTGIITFDSQSVTVTFPVPLANPQTITFLPIYDPS